jgi:hypothetical protein
MSEPVIQAKADGSEVSQAPIVIDLGKVRGKRIKQLKQGEGPLVAEVEEVLRKLRQQADGELVGKQLLPVVLLYQKKRKKISKGFLNPFN